MSAKENNNMSRDEVVEKIYNALVEELNDNISGMIMDGYTFVGLNNLKNSDLEAAYNENFGTEISIVG